MRSPAESASEMCDGRLRKEKAVGSCATRWGAGLEHPTDPGCGAIPAIQPKARSQSRQLCDRGFVPCTGK